VSRPRKSIYARTLGQTTVLAPRALTGQDGDPHRRFLLTFTDVGGIKDMEGREARVVLDPRELAGILGAVPSKDIPEDAHVAMLRVQRFLNHYHEGNEEESR
jgi:hypothetical protein